MEKTKSIVLEAYGEDFPYDEYASLASKMYHERYDGGKLPMKKGVKDILEYLKENNKKIALASSSRKETVEKELRDAGIYSFFDEIVTGDMVNRSKPEPDIFLKACEAVGVKPDRAYAIEDSYNGIRAAFRGGLKPIMVPDLLEADDEMKKISDKVLNDLNAVIGYLNE
jgi:HAD superfamily hydrolase (TIGR01509 family)